MSMFMYIFLTLGIEDILIITEYLRDATITEVLPPIIPCDYR